MIRRIDWPIASFAAYPKMRSAALFHEVMVPFRALPMIARRAARDERVNARRGAALPAHAQRAQDRSERSEASCGHCPGRPHPAQFAKRTWLKVIGRNALA